MKEEPPGFSHGEDVRYVCSQTLSLIFDLGLKAFSEPPRPNGRGFRPIRSVGVT